MNERIGIMSAQYISARNRYAELGIDTEKAMEILKEIPITIHCWQGDDVTGFENMGESLSGGIQATGNYPGKAGSLDVYKRQGCKHISGRKAKGRYRSDV